MSYSAWRHWGCVTPKIITKISDAADIDGYEDLKPDDQDRVRNAVEAGHVAPEDVPESAQKPDGEEEKPKRARKVSKKDEDGEGEEKPKRARATSSKVRTFHIFLLVAFSSEFYRRKLRLKRKVATRSKKGRRERRPPGRGQNPRRNLRPRNAPRKKSVSFFLWA